MVAVCFFKKFADAREKVASRTDYRIRLMNDIVGGIQAIKMYTWEKPFMKLTQEARK